MKKKLSLIFREVVALVREHKLYFLAPLLFVIALITLMIIKFGGGVVMTFIYAGV